MPCLAERAALSIAVPIRRQLKAPFFRYLMSAYALWACPLIAASRSSRNSSGTAMAATSAAVFTSTSRRRRGARNYDRCGSRAAGLLDNQNIPLLSGKPRPELARHGWALRRQGGVSQERCPTTAATTSRQHQRSRHADTPLHECHGCLCFGTAVPIGVKMHLKGLCTKGRSCTKNRESAQKVNFLLWLNSWW